MSINQNIYSVSIENNYVDKGYIMMEDLPNIWKTKSKKNRRPLVT